MAATSKGNKVPSIAETILASFNWSDFVFEMLTPRNLSENIFDARLPSIEKEPPHWIGPSSTGADCQVDVNPWCVQIIQAAAPRPTVMSANQPTIPSSAS